MKKRMMQLFLAVCLCMGMHAVAAAEELPDEAAFQETEQTEEEADTLEQEEELFLFGSTDIIETSDAPDLTVVKNTNHPSGLPVGAIYYTNVPDSEEGVECYIQVYDEFGNQVESFYDTGGVTGEYNMIRLATESEEPLTTGEYTIKAKYAIYDEETDEMTYGEGTTITYDYEQPDSAYETPSVSWKNDMIRVDFPEALPDNTLMVLYVGYFCDEYDEYFPLEESWAYILAEDEDFLQEALMTEMEWMQESVADRILAGEDLADGYYQCRVRVLSNDICKKYHSDWSDWCMVGELPEGDEEEDQTLPSPNLMWLTERTTVGTQKFGAGKLLLTDIPDIMETVKYQMEVYLKNQNGTETLLESHSSSVSGGQNAQTMNLGWYQEGIMESGTYVVKMYYKGDDGETCYDSDVTELEFDYTRPSAQYGKITELGWDGERISYTLPADAPATGEDDPTVCIEIARLNFDGTVNRNWTRGGQHNEDGERLQNSLADIANKYGDGKYVYRMRVISWNLLEKSHSEWSDWSEPITIGEEVTITPEKVVAWENGIPAVDTEVLKQAADVEKVKVMAVLYNASGRCVNVVMADYDAENGYDLSAFNAGGAGTTAKVFLYGDKITPLCEESERP